MFTPVLLLIACALASSVLSAITPDIPGDYGPFFTQFALAELENATSVGAQLLNIQELTAPLHKDGENLTDFHICIQENNPFRANCAKAIEAWRSEAHRHHEVYVSKGTCRAASWGCCQSVVCAPLYLERRMPVWELMGRFWKLLQDRCTHPEAGGVWRPKGVKALYVLSRPESGSCEVDVFEGELKRV